MSAASKLIDEVIRLELSKSVKAAGFKKRGRNFHRTLPECVQLVNVQASQWNSGANGSFTLNLGVWFPAVAKVARRLTGRNLPREVDCTVRQRIGFLTPERLDKWWEVASETNLQDLSKECAGVFSSCGLPWLEKVRDLDSLYEEVFVRNTCMQYVHIDSQIGILRLTNRVDDLCKLARDYMGRADEKTAGDMRAYVRTLGVEL